MEERNSRFPERENRIPDRGGRLLGSQSRIVRQPLRLRRIVGPLLVLGVAAVLYYFNRQEPPPSPYRVASPAPTATLEQTNSPVVSFSPAPESAFTVDSTAATLAPPEAGAEDALVSIGLGFRPIGFRIAASSGRLKLAGRIPPELSGLPSLQGTVQKYGTLELRDGRRYPFLLDGAPDGYLLYLDRNRNGDLRDDGPPVKNRGPDRFAEQVKLPLAQLSGVSVLHGNYVLWFFTSPGEWEEGWLNYYCMTQLSGELLLNGRRYRAYLADNFVIDGDYRNDGIYIDLDGDSRIDPATEFFPPGSTVTVSGGRYRFQVTY